MNKVLSNGFALLESRKSCSAVPWSKKWRWNFGNVDVKISLRITFIMQMRPDISITSNQTIPFIFAVTICSLVEAENFKLFYARVLHRIHHFFESSAITKDSDFSNLNKLEFSL